MMTVKLLVAAVALASCLSSAQAMNSPEPSLQDKQQAACYGDVQRLCGAAMPDVNKVTECMKDKRPQVSAKCSAMWDVK